LKNSRKLIRHRLKSSVSGSFTPEELLEVRERLRGYWEIQVRRYMNEEGSSQIPAYLLAQLLEQKNLDAAYVVAKQCLSLIPQEDAKWKFGFRAKSNQTSDDPLYLLIESIRKHDLEIADMISRFYLGLLDDDDA
jgi:hypothetical protein